MMRTLIARRIFDKALVIKRISPVRAAAVMALCCLAPAAAAQQGPVETISEVPRKGRLALFKAQEKKDEGKPGEAARIFSEFLEKSPDEDHFLLRYHYGNTLMSLERGEEALAQFRMAVGMEQRFWQGWLNLGETAYNLEKYSEAARAIMKGYELNPDRQPRLLYFAAAAHIMAGDPGSAKPLLEELVFDRSIEQRLDWFRAMIMACADLGDRETGDRAADRMLELFGDDPAAWDLAFQHAASFQDYRSAAVALTVKSYLTPLDRAEKMQLGNLYAAIEIPYAASIWYEAAIDTSAESRDWEKLASVYMAAHEPEMALETLRTALDNDPTAKLWSLLGDLYYLEEDYDNAYDAFGRSLEIDPDSGRALLMMGYCALETGRAGKAAEHLRAAAAYPDYSANANALLKRALEARGS